MSDALSNVAAVKLAIAVARLHYSLKCNPKLRDALQRPLSVNNAMAELARAADIVLAQANEQEIAAAQEAV